ncbi:fatty acid desaturase family protein [Limnovirga soli]|uniref:Fatty acid desaturase domain-containing protein n=1 Tax=Limnovirga soli TaxID=2656915 RepID=A0A8J8FFH5_9BACT|nr:acyl-CoA desaturase [Limnovirga soli]NNV55898.1 hypothetical protein [Limnovirga soli]
MQPVKFKPAKCSSLPEDLKKAVANYFSENKVSSYGDSEMIFKVAFWLVAWVITYFTIILAKDNFLLAVTCGLIHMFTHVMIAFNITHDANHDAIFKSKKLNTFFGYFIELLGCSRNMWILSHNQEHHTYINISEHDNNIEGYGILRLTPEDKWMKHHKYQWLYAPFVYGLSTLNYATLRDFKMIAKYAASGKIKMNAAFVAEFVFFKVLYYGYVFIIPIFVFDVSIWIVLTYFLIGHFVNGLFLALVFVTGHLTEDTLYPEVKDDRTIDNNWSSHVISTTGDYAVTLPFMQWLVGGINLHVAHHLFPKVCHTHYKDISPVIKEVATKHGMVYREIPGFWGAMRSHFVLLKQLGVNPAIAVSKASVA